MVDEDRKAKVRGTWQPRFGLSALLMVMLISCIMASAGYYLVQAIDSGLSVAAISIIMAMAAPPLLLTLVSLMRLVHDWLERRRR